MTCTLVNETCPAAVSTVTVVTNTFAVDGVTTDYVNAVAAFVANVHTLAAIPVLDTFSLFKNGQKLVSGVDYTLSDDTVTLLVAQTADDVYVVNYLATPA